MSENMIHHVNGNHEDEKPQNLLRLCIKCHDLIQGICDKCVDQKDCFVQKLQRCWAFEDALPPIYFRGNVDPNAIPLTESHIKSKKIKKPNEIIDLVKTGHVINTSMIPETYINSKEFLEKAVQCRFCGRWIKWRLSPGMTSITCSMCVQVACGNPPALTKKGQTKKLPSRIRHGLLAEKPHLRLRQASLSEAIG